MKILVLQHAAHEGLGAYEEELKKANITWEMLPVNSTTLFPSGTKLEEYNGFIILGGPMGVWEREKYPWMEKELMIIREILRQKKPTLGICLGAQLLAEASGGRAYRGAVKEIGWHPIKLDDWFYKRNPLFFQIDPTKEHMVFQWHGDSFDIGTEGYRLAWNETYPNQAFCFNGNAVGLQFHPEMTEEMIKNWLSGEGAEQARESGANPEQIIADIPKYLPAMKDFGHKIMYGFISLIRENVRRAA